MKFKTVKSKVIFFLSILSLFGILFCIESCQNDLTFGKTTININLDLSKIIKTARNENSQNNTEFVLKLFVYDTQNYKNGAEIEKLPLVTQSVNKVDITGNVKVSLEVEVGSNIILVAKLHSFINGKESESPVYSGNTEVITVKSENNKVHLNLFCLETFTVTFNSLGGSYIESQQVDKNTNASIPEEPTKNGYVFAGWYTSTDGGKTLDTEFDFESKITSNITLYAMWYYTSSTVISGISSLDTEGPHDIIVAGEIDSSIISSISSALKEIFHAKVNLDLSRTTGVTSVEERAFYGCSSLTSITIPDSVTSIRDSAFSFCSGLQSITIPATVTIICDFAFFWCSNLATVNYIGTEVQWNAIGIGSDNSSLTTAAINYNYIDD